MTRRVVRQDRDLCIGCMSCEIHCKTARGLGVGPRPCRVFTLEEPYEGGTPQMTFVVVACQHCDDPECVRVCPTGAMRKRPDDGIVWVSTETCVGCRLCVHACPWGVPEVDPVTEEIVKCDLCRDRLDQGLRPACVTKCVTGCLSLEESPDEPLPSICRGEGGVEVSS